MERLHILKSFFGISVYGVLTFASGSFDLTDNQLMNMMLGPQVSRPFVQSVHAFAAVGFVMGKYLLFFDQFSSEFYLIVQSMELKHSQCLQNWDF